MGVTNISNALKQMDGIFGCKVSLDLNEQTKTLEFSFAKKTIVDIVVEFFSKEKKDDQNAEVMIALWSMQQKMGDKDNGSFNAIIRKYAENNDLIDFKEIRRVLRALPNIEFAPVVYERNEKKDLLNQAKDCSGVQYYKAEYLRDIKNCMAAETEVKLYRDEMNDQVSDENLEGFAEAVIEFQKVTGNQEPIYVDEKNPEIKQRFDEKLKEVEKRVAPVEKFKSRNKNNVDGTDDSERSEEYNYSIAEKIEVSDKKNAVASPPAKKQPSSRNRLLNVGRLPDFKSGDKLMLLQDWVDIYQTRLTNRTFVIDGAATVYCERDGSVSEENLKAFCFALLALDNNDELPNFVYGGSEYNDAWIYFALCETDAECAKRVKERMQPFAEEVMAAKFSEEFSGAETADVLVSINPLLDKEEWINFYDNKYKAGNFLKDGVAQITRDPDGDVSPENLEAFCEILVHLSKNKVKFSINEDSESMRTQIYLELYDRDLIRSELRPVDNKIDRR